jgi:RNA polymerase sigma-70 factor (ECF subfamily)
MRLAVSPELIEAARDPGGGGMERLLGALWPHAYRIAHSVIQNDSLAEDAAQEACAIIYREISGLRSAGAFRVWAYRIVVREALRVAERNAPARSDFEQGYAEDVDSRMDVLRALQQLPPDLRAAVVLHYYADLNSREIGSALRIPSATVRFRLAQARRRLGRLLSDRNESSTPIADEVRL